jgi:hypothetical protein
VAEDYSGGGRSWAGYVHVVEPTGPYEPDPVDPPSYQAYRSEHPLRVISVSEYWG